MSENSTIGNRLPAVGLASLILLGFARVASAQEGFGDPVLGQAIFQSQGCVRCHAVRGAGGRIGPDLGRKGVRGSFYDIAADMWNHLPAMGEKMREFHLTRPRFENEGDLANLAAFLYFLKYFDEPGDREAGKILFTEKHCVRCHAVAGVGGQYAPRLDGLPRSVPPLRIAQDLWNHGSSMVAAMQVLSLDVPTFEGNEIIDLLAYLRSQGERRAAREFQSAGDPVNGRRFFDTKGCSRCHTIFGSGSKVGPDLGAVELRGSVTQIAGRMWNHWPEMNQAMRQLGIERPQFVSDELADIFAYIFIARYEGTGTDVGRGETMYRVKGCATCHGEGAEGDIGPALNADPGAATKENITQRMWNHGPDMWEKMMEQQIPWPRFEADELADLLAYLKSIQSATSDSPSEGRGHEP